MTEERAYHLESVTTVHEYASGVWKYCGVESMYWRLDVIFREDTNRTRTGQAPQNLTLLKRMEMNMVKKDEERYPKRELEIQKVSCLIKGGTFFYIFSINFR